MAAIVYLDVDDEITSAAARLRTLADDRIALVLPLGSRLATSRINFRLLAREATAHKKTLEIVTSDASTRALAASAGLATHTSVAAFEGRPEVAGPAAVPGPGAAPQSTPPQSAPPRAGPATAGPRTGRAASGHQAPQPTLGLADETPTAVVQAAPELPVLRPPRAAPPVPQVGPRRQAPQLTSQRVAIGVAIVAILIVGGLVGLQALPSATVTLTPGVDQLGPIQLNVTAQAGITQPDPSKLLVPAHTYAFDLDVSDTFPATGVKIDEKTAQGAVTFENCDTGRGVTIPERSIVSTGGGIHFATRSKVTLKRAHLFPLACDAATVPVSAVLPGLSGNVAAGAINRIPEGFDPVVLRVTNQDPTTGGTHTETKQVAQADIDAAMSALTDKLGTTFDDKIAAAEGVPRGTKLFTETKVLGTATPSVDPKTLLDTLVDTFDLGLTAKGTVIGVDSSPVATLADARIRSSVKDGFNLVEDSIKIDVGAPLVTGSTITFPVIANAIATREVDVSALRARIHGLGLPQARTVLAAFGKVTITVWPDWVTTIPTNDGRLSFTITAPAAPSASPRTTSTAAP